MSVQAYNPNIAANYNANIYANTPINPQEQIYLGQKADTVTFSRNNCSENMSLRKTNFSFAKPEYSYTGTINGKDSYIEVSQNGMFKPVKEIAGRVGDNEINYVQTCSNGIKNKNIKGEYNGNTFELNFEPGLFMFNTSTINGKINGKEVQFTFPGSKVPQEEDVKDILTSLLMVEGYKPASSKGVFKNLQTSEWKEKANQEEAAFMMAQSSVPAYTPTWHYDMVGLPGGAPTFY